MTNLWLSEFDSTAVQAFEDVGLAEGEKKATYYSADGALSGIPCKVLVDRNILSLARLGIEVIEDSVLLRVQRAFIENRPKRGDAFAIGCEEFTVEKLIDQDESMWTCLCLV